MSTDDRFAHLSDITGQSARKSMGVVGPSTATYVSGTGTAGTANTAMTVLTRTLPANTLSVVGDRMRVRLYFFANTSAPIVAAVKVGPAAAEVTVADISHGGGATAGFVEAWLHYIDNTHCNVIEHESGAMGNQTVINEAGFDHDSAQNIIVTQNAVSGNYITVFGLFVDIFPLAVA